MIRKMWAVVDTEYGVLVGVFLMKEDAQALLSTFSDKKYYEVREFDLNWDHWIEYRKELGIY